MCGKHLRITVNHSYCHFGVRQQLDTLDFLLFLTTTVMFVKGKYFDPRDTFTSHELHVYTLI